MRISVPRGRLSQQERLAFARRRVVMPVALFLGLVLAYVALIAATLAAPMALAIPLSIGCGPLIGVLFIVGHDACHNSFTRLSPLNQIIARIAFLPSWQSFTSWDLGHNQMHHRYNNLRGWDAVWEPLSPDEYRARGPLGRWFYRFFRSPAGVPFYYMIVLWAPSHLGTLPYIRRNRTVRFWLDLTLVFIFVIVQGLAVIWFGHHAGRGALASLTLGVLVPFLVWNGFMSFIIFLHHTHPALRWYSDLDAWKAGQGVTGGTAHVRFAWPIGEMILSIMEHNAHHTAPGVPFYNLVKMQRALEEHEDILSWGFSRRGYIRVCRRCQLYDYDEGRWVSFGATQP